MRRLEQRGRHIERHSADLDEEIRVRLIELYGTDNPSLGQLKDLLALSQTRRRSDTELISFIKNSYAALTLED